MTLTLCESVTESMGDQPYHMNISWMGHRRAGPIESLPAMALRSEFFFMLLMQLQHETKLVIANPTVCHYENMLWDGEVILEEPLSKARHGASVCRNLCRNIEVCQAWTFKLENSTYPACRLYNKTTSLKSTAAAVSGFSVCPDNECACADLIIEGEPCNLMKNNNLYDPPELGFGLNQNWASCRQGLMQLKKAEPSCSFFIFDGAICRLMKSIDFKRSSLLRGFISGNSDAKCEENDFCSESREKILGEIIGLDKGKTLEIMLQNSTWSRTIRYDVHWDEKKRGNLKDVHKRIEIEDTTKLDYEMSSKSHDNTLYFDASSTDLPVQVHVSRYVEKTIYSAKNTSETLFVPNISETVSSSPSSLPAPVLLLLSALISRLPPTLFLCYVLTMTSGAEATRLKAYDVLGLVNKSTVNTEIALSIDFIPHCDEGMSISPYRFNQRHNLQIFSHSRSRLIEVLACQVIYSTRVRHCDKNILASYLYPSIDVISQEHQVFSSAACSLAHEERTISLKIHDRSIVISNVGNERQTITRTIGGQAHYDGSCSGQDLIYGHLHYQSVVVYADISIKLTKSLELYSIKDEKY